MRTMTDNEFQRLKGLLHKKIIEVDALRSLFREQTGRDYVLKGGWEIDHKIPISVFNFTKPEHRDFKRCWALSNLQPMWAKDNILKNNKITKHFQPSLLI